MTLHTLPRKRSFKDDIRVAINDNPVEDLTDALYDLHMSETAPLRDELERAKREASDAAEQLRRSHYVLGQVQALAAHQIQTVARHGANAAHQAQVMRDLRKIALAAQGGSIPAADVIALLQAEVEEPEFAQVALAFYACSDYRAGVFSTFDGAFQVTFPFVGYTTVLVSAAGGVAVQPTFLVQDRGALPAGVIELERGLTLQMPLLPNVTASAA